MSVGKRCISIRFKNRICVKMLEPNDYVAMILGHMVIAGAVLRDKGLVVFLDDIKTGI